MVHGHPVGIRFNGKERHDVTEFCVGEGWIKVAAGAIGAWSRGSAAVRTLSQLKRYDPGAVLFEQEDKCEGIWAIEPLTRISRQLATSFD